MESELALLIPIFAIMFTFGRPGIIIFWAIQSKHRERVKLIDKGLTPEEVKAYFKEAEKKPRSPYPALKWGMLFLFLGIAFFLSTILEYAYEIGEDLLPAFLLFFGGAAFIIYYLIAKSKTNGASVPSQNKAE
jgi:hypothetical protein